MKPDIHPNYRPVVFHDTSADVKFITRSTVETTDTIEWEDGTEYPLRKVEISSASHPFYTGTMTIVDTAGRVERFERRYGKRRKDGSEPVGDEAATDESVTDEPVTDEAAAEAPAADAADAASD